MTKADIVVRCTSLEEALAVSRICTNPISDSSCKERFDFIYPKYGHLDFVFKELFANVWGDYADIIRLDLVPNDLPIISGWEFLGEPTEGFQSDDLNALLELS
ncbi:MAG: hypothetical protein IIW69_08140 [Bacteroidaceae bacterium]|nr:hypothetical protein [Bacteroidaceae bacterium]